MPRQDHVPLSQESFRGLYQRGLADSCPDSYGIGCINNIFAKNDVMSRHGTELKHTAANIVRCFVYRRINETPRFIYLDTSGRLFDSLFTPAIWTDATITDFSMAVVNNRAYISPHNTVTGIPNKNVLVYEGSGTARQAAGVAPTGFVLGAAVSALSGTVEAGIHLFGVVNITASGFITSIGPDNLTALICPGDFKVALTNIAVGPAGTVSRAIVATKAIPEALYNGNQYGYEFFLIPDAVIEDNTTTILTVDFFDANLVRSADYLFDNLETIPAGVFITTYNGRLVVGGIDGEENTTRFSEQDDPETFSDVVGFVTLGDSVTGVKNGAEFRKSFLIFESNRISAVTDNDSDPNTWGVITVDKATGTECFGINTVLSSAGLNNDRLFFADKAGLFSYEGLVKRPALSTNIEDLWSRINKAHFNLVQVVDDPIKHRLLITAPIDANTKTSHILYADYSEAFTVYGTLDERAFKWSIWDFPSAPWSIVGDFEAVTKDSVIYIALSAGNIYQMKDGLLNDFGNAIVSYFTSSLKTALKGWINHFGWIKMRVTGSGTLNLTLYGEDFTNPTVAPAITMAASPGLEPDSLINFINEKMAVKFGVTSIDEYYRVNRLEVWAKELWISRAG